MKKGSVRQQVVPLVKPVPAPAGQATPRIRVTGDRILCPKCLVGDGFVTHSWRCHPQFIENAQRIRRFKCGSCGHTWKG